MKILKQIAIAILLAGTCRSVLAMDQASKSDAVKADYMNAAMRTAAVLNRAEAEVYDVMNNSRYLFNLQDSPREKLNTLLAIESELNKAQYPELFAQQAFIINNDPTVNNDVKDQVNLYSREIKTRVQWLNELLGSNIQLLRLQIQQQVQQLPPVLLDNHAE